MGYDPNMKREQKDICRELFAEKWGKKKYRNYLTLGGEGLWDIQSCLSSGVIDKTCNVQSWERFDPCGRGWIPARIAEKTARRIGFKDSVNRGNILHTHWEDKAYKRFSPRLAYSKPHQYDCKFDLVNADFCGPLTWNVSWWIENMLQFGVTDNARIAFTFNCKHRQTIQSKEYSTIHKTVKQFRDHSEGWDNNRIRLVNPHVKITTTPNTNGRMPCYKTMQHRDATILYVKFLAEAAGFQVKVRECRCYCDTRNDWMIFILLELKGRKVKLSSVGAHKAWVNMYQDRIRSSQTAIEVISLALQDDSCKVDSHEWNELYDLMEQCHRDNTKAKVAQIRAQLFVDACENMSEVRGNENYRLAS